MKKLHLSALAVAILTSTAAFATECPPGAASCKIVVVTPQEEATLTGPGGVFDLAVWANRSSMADLTAAWKKKITDSPDGEVKSVPLPKPAPEAAKGSK